MATVLRVTPEEIEQEKKLNDWSNVLFVEVSVSPDYERSPDFEEALKFQFKKMSGRDIPILVAEGFKVFVHSK